MFDSLPKLCMKGLRIHWKLLAILKRSKVFEEMDTLKAFHDFKTYYRSAWSNVFWYVKVYIFWKFIEYTNAKKIFFGPNKRYKKYILFSFASSAVLLLICISYTSWSTWFNSLKLCEEFSIFDSVSILSKFVCFFIPWLWNVIISFKMKIIEKPHTVSLPNFWFLS